MNTFKRILALMLSLLLIVGCFSACGGEGNPQETTESKVTEPPEEAKVLKVLTLGHSLAVDCGHMLAKVAHAEGYESMVVGTLYYSGCPLVKHVEFLSNNSREYALYVSSTETPDVAPKTMQNVTMQEALTYDYWDVIVMQGGVFDIAREEDYTAGYIQAIQKYVNENKKNPNASFCWNMTWVPPVDEDLCKTYEADLSKNTYYSRYDEYNHDRSKMYQAVAKCVGDNIMTDKTFEKMIPVATVYENALSSYLTEKDMHRDYVHASDLARVMVAYTWFAVLTGKDQLEAINLDVIPRSLLKTTLGGGSWTLTDAEKAIVLESVNNALKNPLQMTQSQYTQAPA